MHRSHQRLHPAAFCLPAVALACATVAHNALAQSYVTVPAYATDGNATQYTFNAKSPALVDEGFTTGTAADTFSWDGSNKPWYYLNNNRTAPVSWPIPTLAPPPWDTAGRAACFNTGTSGAADSYLELAKGVVLQENKRYRVTATIGTVNSQAVSVWVMLGDSYVPSIVRTYDIAAVANNKKVIQLDGVFVKPNSPVGSKVAFRFSDQNVNVCIDDIKVVEIDANPMNPVADLDFPATGAASPVLPKVRSKKIDNKLFGYNANRWDQQGQWAPLGQTVQRLWDNGVYWAALQPNSASSWDPAALARLDQFVNNANNSQRSIPLILTLGMTPLWATGQASCTLNGNYPSACVEPPSDANLAAWRQYIKTMATRYQGKIKYFELWNEPDVGNVHFGGNGQRLAVLASHAKQALQEADPSNTYGFKLIGPSITSFGMNFMDQFLRAGGGSSVDYFSIHAGFSVADAWDGTDPRLPENQLPAMIANGKALIYAHGLQAKPLWVTEGQPKCVGFCPPSDQKARSLMFRALMTLWSNGIDNFNPHVMEGPERDQGLTYSAMATAASNYSVLTPFGEGFQFASSWFKNATVTSAYPMLSSIYVFHVTQSSGEKQYVLWSVSPTDTTMYLPNKPSIFYPQGWNVNTMIKLDTLNGTSSAIPTNRLITLQPYTPVLLKP